MGFLPQIVLVLVLVIIIVFSCMAKVGRGSGEAPSKPGFSALPRLRRHPLE
jgi:hypothetical protein